MINLNECRHTKKHSYFSFNNDIMKQETKSRSVLYFSSAEVLQAHILTLVLNLEVNLGSWLHKKTLRQGRHRAWPCTVLQGKPKSNPFYCV